MPLLKNYRHEKFAQAILKGKNQTQAAIEAGYVKSRARNTGSQLVAYGDIQARIRELNAEIVSSLILTAKERKEMLSEIARGRLTDFVRADEKGTHIQVDLESAHSAALQEVSTTTTHYKNKKGEDGKVTVTKLKLYNPISAMAELTKMEGDYAPSKVEVEPGEKMGEALAELLSRLRGYEKKG